MKDIPELSLATMWDHLTPQERDCWAMQYDARNGPPEYRLKLISKYSSEFQEALNKKCASLALKFYSRPDRESAEIP